MAHERFLQRAHRAPARQQQGQPGEAELGIGITRHQPGHQRIGKTPVRGDRIDFAVAPPIARLSLRQRRLGRRDGVGRADLEPVAR